MVGGGERLANDNHLLRGNNSDSAMDASDPITSLHYGNLYAHTSAPSALLSPLFILPFLSSR